MGSNSVTRNTRRVITAQSVPFSREKNTLPPNALVNKIPINSDLWSIPEVLVTLPNRQNYSFDDISESPVEIGIVYDKNGNIVTNNYYFLIDGDYVYQDVKYFTNNNTDSLAIHRPVTKNIRNNILVHNHPNPSSFSGGDLTVLKANPLEMHIRHPSSTNKVFRELANTKLIIPSSNSPEVDNILKIAKTETQNIPKNYEKIGERIYRSANNKWGNNLIRTDIKNKDFVDNMHGKIYAISSILQMSNRSASSDAIHYLATLAVNKYYANKYGYNHEIFEVK